MACTVRYRYDDDLPEGQHGPIYIEASDALEIPNVDDYVDVDDQDRDIRVAGQVCARAFQYVLRNGERGDMITVFVQNGTALPRFVKS